MFFKEIWTLAWKNLGRNMIRTFITVLAVGGSLFFAIILINETTGSYRKMIDQGVRSGSGHIGIYQKGFLEDRLMGQSFVIGDLLEEIQKIAGVKEILPHLQFSTLAQSAYASREALLMGVLPAREAQINPYVQKISAGRFLRYEDNTQAVIGSELARELKVDVGNSFIMKVQGKNGVLQSERFHVVGIIKSGIKNVDNYLVMAHLSQVQKITQFVGEAHELSVLLQSASLVESAYSAIKPLISKRPNLEAVSWKEAMPKISNAIRLSYTYFRLIIFFLVVIVGVGIINTFLMSVLERSREFGILMSIGTPPGFLIWLVITEAFFNGIMGVMVGLILGSAGTYYLIVHGLDLSIVLKDGREYGGVFFDSLIRADWNIPSMIFLSIFFILICIGASLYPAWKAGRVNPIEVLR